MNMVRRINVAVILTAAINVSALTGPALAAGTVTKPLSQMFPVLDRYLQQPQERRTLFRVRYCAQTLTREPLAVRYVLDGRDVTLATDSTGCFANLPELADLRVNPAASANAAEGEFKIIVALEPSAPLDRVMTMESLRAAVEQADTAARRAAGPLAWAVPHLDSVHFEFGEPDQSLADLGMRGVGGPGEAFAIFTDGRRETLPLRDGRIMVAPRDPRIAGAERVAFSTPPLAARIGFSNPVRR
jgi:hypothetical protein